MAKPTWSLTGAVSSKAVGTGTDDAPTLATEGSQLNGVRGFVVCLEADSTRTLSGAGTLLAYLYDPFGQIWCRAPDLDLYVTASAVRGQAWPGNEVVVGKGRIAYVCSGVTVSAGGTTIYINCTDGRGLADTTV
jgi:hypothetical protein